MGYGIHINQNPNNTFSFVGSIPIELMDTRKPTTADVMAGRTIDGVAYYTKAYPTAQELVERAKAANVELCKQPKCACRKHF